MKTSNKYASAIGIIIGIILTVVLLNMAGGPGGVRTAVDKIVEILSTADIRLIAMAFVLFFLSQVFRAIRWILLTFNTKVPFSLSLPVTSIHVGLGHILPVRLTDIAFVGLFRHFGKVPVGYGTATVILAKLLDLIAMGIVMGSALAMGIGALGYVVPVLILIGMVGVFFLAPILKWIRPLLRVIFRRFREGRNITWYDDLLEAASLRQRKGRLTGSLAISILAWICKLTMFCLLLAALGITLGANGIPFWQVFFAAAITDLTMALPVHGLFSFGTVELGWTAGFKIVGIAAGTTLSGFDIVELGFSVHILWMIMAVVLMILGIPLLWFGKRK